MKTDKPARTQDKALAGTTFSELAPAEHYGLTLNVRGGEKVGKTYQCLATSPEPIAYLNGDRDNSHLLRWLMRRGRKIWASRDYCYSLPGPKQITRAMSAGEQKDINTKNAALVLPIWQRFVKEFQAALESKARTVVVDTGTWVYQTVRLAKFGTLSIPKWMAQEYKGDMEAVMHMPDEYGKLVIWIHRSAPEWEDFINAEGEKDSRTTGRMRTEGFDKVDYVVDATVEISFDLEDTGKRQAKIMSGIRAAGTTFEGTEGKLALDIPHIAAHITNTAVEHWE